MTNELLLGQVDMTLALQDSWFDAVLGHNLRAHEREREGGKGREGGREYRSHQVTFSALHLGTQTKNKQTNKARSGHTHKLSRGGEMAGCFTQHITQFTNVVPLQHGPQPHLVHLLAVEVGEANVSD